MPIRAVVFDLDGLMFNTEVIFNEVGHEVLKRRGRVMTPELIQQMMGRRAPEALRAMIDFHQLEDTVQQLADESRNLFFELAENRLEPMPGLLSLLDHLDEMPLPKGVATSSNRPYVDRILGQFELLGRFPMILTAEDVKNGKPHPEIYLTAAQNLGVEPTEMLVFEDSEMGTNAAAAANAVVVSVPHEHSAHHNFENATLIAEHLFAPDVLKLLAR